MKLKAKTLIPALVMLVAACATTSSPTGARAVSTLEGKSGSDAFGIVTFTELSNGSVLIRADLSNVPPGMHGFHIHETGNCSSPDAKSAGGHFNPDGQPHAGPDASAHHAGDLGNVDASSSGRVDVEMTSDSLSVSPGPRSVIGRAVVLHAGADDLESQPSGAAGARIACGVINLSPTY